MIKAVFATTTLCLALAGGGLAQTTHPLLVRMQEKARLVDQGSYRLMVKEHYPYSTDTILYRAECAFSRFEQLDGKPGIRYEINLETQYPKQTLQQHIVFDGQVRHDFKGDTLVMLYDSRELGEEFTLRGLQHFFFIPLLLQQEVVQKYLGPDKYLGTPPYETLADTLVDGVPCHLVGADWPLDTSGLLWQHLRFGISQTSGLPLFFSQVEETKEVQKNNSIQRRSLMIRLDNWSTEIPMNSFYVDWLGLPPGIEVKRFHDCYHKETIRPRNQPGL